MQDKQINLEFDYKFIPAKKEKKGTILFIHGFCVDYKYFVCDQQVAEHYDFYALNLPGHGPKNKVQPIKQAMKSSFNFDYMSNYVIKFIEEMKLNDIYLIGHSMGGAIVSLVAIKMPAKIKKLVLVSPMNFASLYTGITFLTKFFPKNMAAKLKLLKYLYKDVSLYINNKEWMKMNEDQLKFQLDNYKQMKYLGKKVMSSLSTLSKVHKAQKQLKDESTMLMLGVCDGIVPYKQTKRNFEKHHPNMKIVTFDNSGHLCFEEETAKFVEELYNFLAK